jgi:hypothetical protein
LRSRPCTATNTLLGSAAASLTPSWAKNGLKHLVCKIADVVAPPLPPEGATVTVEEQIRCERLSLHRAATHCSCALQLPPLHDAADDYDDDDDDDDDDDADEADDADDDCDCDCDCDDVVVLMMIMMMLI